MNDDMLNLPLFNSIYELQADHAQMVNELADDVLEQDNLRRIKAFVRKCVNTGMIVDALSDRAVAQSVITFWTARVASKARAIARQLLKNGGRGELEDIPAEPDFEDTLLAEFNPILLDTKVITPANSWWNHQSHTKQKLAKRIVLRMVRLREKDDVVESRSGAIGVCDDLEPREAAEDVLKELIKVGVVRKVRTEGGQDEVALQTPALLDRWRLLQEWILDRRSFRQQALNWTKRPKKKDWFAFFRQGESIFTDEQFDEAKTYRDRIDAELNIIYYSRKQYRDRNKRRKIYAAVSLVIATIFGCISLVAIMALYGSEKIRGDLAKETESLANKTKLAERLSDELIIEKEKIREENTNLQNQIKITVFKTVSEYTKTLSATRPQQSVLLSWETLRFANSLPEKWHTTDKRFSREGMVSLAEENVRKAMASISGEGFYANLGAITHVAAHEHLTDKNKDELCWLAAAGSNGSIAVWDLRLSKIESPKIYSFGFTTPLKRLFITSHGYLVALDSSNYITRWNLNQQDRPCQVIGPIIQPDRNGFNSTEVTSTPQGDWLSFDLGDDKGCLVGCDDERGFQRSDYILGTDIPDWGIKKVLSSRYSFSMDQRWFARFTEAGDAIVWNINGKGPSRPQHLPGPPNSKAKECINGEFLSDNKRLVIFYANGWARYYDLDESTGKWHLRTPELYIMSLKKGDLVENVRVFANRRGTHAIIVPFNSQSKEVPNSRELKYEAYCFDANDYTAETSAKNETMLKRLKDFDLNYRSDFAETDETGRWLVAKSFRSADSPNPLLRIWDLHRLDKDGAGIMPQIAAEPIAILNAKPLDTFPTIAMRGLDNIVRLLDLKRLSWRQLRGHEASVESLAQSQHGRFLVSGAKDGSVRVWSLNPLSQSVEPFVYQVSAHNTLITSDRRWLVVSLPDGAMRFRRLERGAVSTEDKDVERLSRQGIAESKDMESASRPAQLISHSHPKGHDLNEPSDLFTTSRGDWVLERRQIETGESNLWNLTGTKPQRSGSLELGSGSVQNFAVGMDKKDKDKAWLVVQIQSNFQSLIRIWALNKGSRQPQLCSPPISGRFIGFDTDGATLLVQTNSSIERWKPSNDSPVEVVHSAPRGFGYVATSPNSQQLIVSKNEDSDANNDYKSRVINLASKDKMKGDSILRSFGSFEQPFFSANGKYLCSSFTGVRREKLPIGDFSNFPVYWNLEEAGGDGGHDLNPTKIQSSNNSLSASVIKISQDRRWMVTSEEGEGFLWDLNEIPRSGKSKSLGKIRSAIFTSDISWLVTADQLGNVSVFDLAGQRPKRSIENFRLLGLALSASVSPDGKLALIAQDQSIYVWNLNSDPAAKPTFLPSGPIPSFQTPSEVLFSSDSARLYSIFPNALRISQVQIEDLQKKAITAVGRNLGPNDLNDLRLDEFKRLKKDNDDTFQGLPIPAALDKPGIPNKRMNGKLPINGSVETNLLEVQDKKAVANGQLGKDSYNYAVVVRGFNAINGPSLTYSVELPAKTACQIDLSSSTFRGVLVLESAAESKVLAAAMPTQSGESRLLFITSEKKQAYFVRVIGWQGDPGLFQLRIQHQ